MTADKAKVVRLLKTAKGQMDGIVRMVEENRYCIDISNQILACQAILSKVNREILNAHLRNCVVSSADKQEYSAKMEEVTAILDKLL